MGCPREQRPLVLRLGSVDRVACGLGADRSEQAVDEMRAVVGVLTQQALQFDVVPMTIAGVGSPASANAFSTLLREKGLQITNHFGELRSC